MLLIVAVSSIPGRQLPKPNIAGFDKLCHMAEFALLGLLLTLGPARVRRRDRWPWLLLLVAFAGADELHQLFVPGRTPSLADALADVCGALIGLSLLPARPSTTHPRPRATAVGTATRPPE